MRFQLIKVKTVIPTSKYSRRPISNSLTFKYFIQIYFEHCSRNLNLEKEKIKERREKKTITTISRIICYLETPFQLAPFCWVLLTISSAGTACLVFSFISLVVIKYWKKKRLKIILIIACFLCHSPTPYL